MNRTCYGNVMLWKYLHQIPLDTVAVAFSKYTQNDRFRCTGR